jgi:diadenosine tetraphosphatase ApaH/serine/threonine PP2A family protein phosphatase
LRLEGFNTTAAKAVEWTRKQLTVDDRRWLSDLEYVRTVENFTIVHSTLESPERWGYVFDRLAAASSFARQDSQVCFFGHTHVPVVFIQDSVVRGGTYSRFKIETGKRYFVNGGSVGQPRDNNPKASYALYDMDAGTVELRRPPYDIAATQKKIRDSGLPFH